MTPTTAPPGSGVGARGLAVLGLSAALTYVAGLWWQAPVLRLWVKPLPVLALAAWVTSASGARGPYARRIALGLLLSALGDVLLEFPSGFVSGLCAFLLAHCAYLAAFLGETRALRLLRGLPFLAYGLALYALLARGLGALAAPVGVYAAALSAMQWRAAACLGSGVRGATAERLGFGGALLFALSDSLIGVDRFHAPFPGARYAIIALYWAGQTGLALSVRARR